MPRKNISTSPQGDETRPFLSWSHTLPKDWNLVPLRKLVHSYRNGIYKKDEYYGHGHPSVRMYNIEDGVINTRNAPLLAVTEQELDFYGLLPDDILINRVNTIGLVGKAGIVPEDLGSATFESKNIRIRLRRDMCHPPFIAYFLGSEYYLRQIRSFVKAAISQATINQSDLDRIQVPVPPLGEQRGIAEVIDVCRHEARIAAALVKQTGLLRQALMQRLLTRGIGHTRFKKAVVGEIPESWVVKKLKEFLDLKYGEGLKAEERKTQGEFPVYGSNGIIGFSEHCLVPHRTLIIGRKGGTGSVHMSESGSWPIDTTFYVDNLDASIVDLHFLYYSLEHSHLSRYTIVTAVPGVNRDTLLNHRVALPPYDEQEAIASILSEIDAETLIESRMIQELERLKKGLMQVLLTGKVRVKV